MTQQERQQRSREEIYQAALEEFGAHGYDGTTVEQICRRHGISKGMMYHYYAGKDELFLPCVERTFQALRDHLEREAERMVQAPFPAAVRDFFMARERFFQANPREKAVFENALLYPPGPLTQRIQALHAPLRELNQRFFLRLAPQMPLRPGLSPEDVFHYLEGVGRCFQAMLACGQAGHEIRDVHTLLEAGGKLMDLVLFGVLQQPTPAPAEMKEEKKVTL